MRRRKPRKSALNETSGYQQVRLFPLFETGSEKYDWLNRIIAVGIGETTTTGAILQVYQIL